MKKEFVGLLRCPKCHGNVYITPDSSQKNKIDEGYLKCENNHTYRIRGGVPRFNENLTDIENRTAAVFGEEWTTFRDYNASNLEKMSPDLPEDFFFGKMVLDAGCGAGRHVMELKNKWKAGAVVGADLSGAVITAHEKTKELANVYIAQASIYELPFASDFFDCVFSLGVLQHLPDPFRAFAKLVSHVKPGGRIIIWVYKDSLRKRILEAPRMLTRRLSVPLQRFVSLATSILFYPLVLLHKSIGFPVPSHFKEYAKYDWSTYRTDWFDRLSAPLTDYYTENEIHNWFLRQSLANIKIMSYGDFFIRAFGTKEM